MSNTQVQSLVPEKKEGKDRRKKVGRGRGKREGRKEREKGLS